MKPILISVFALSHLILVGSNACANPKIARSNPEKLFGAMDLGTHFNDLPKGLKPIGKTPEIPSAEMCAEDGLIDGRIQCEYKSISGLIYRIDDNGLVYNIEIMADEKTGKFSVKLPFTIKVSDSQEKLMKKFKKLGFETFKHNTNLPHVFYRSACILTDAPKGKATCFEYNRDMKIYRISIFFRSEDD